MRRVPRFFVDSAAVRRGIVLITDADASHLARSLRVHPGERIVVVEDGRWEHGVVVTTVAPHRVSGRVAWSRPATGEPRLAVHVLQAVPARAMDDAVEALAAAGARAVHPVQTERAVVRPAPGASRRLERWQAVAREAAQLAGRAAAPLVHPLTTLPDALAALPPRCRILACVPDSAATPLHSLRLSIDDPVACVIGPEGGLGRADRGRLLKAGAEPVHLGARVLPSRLAGHLAVSLILAGCGDLDEPPAPPPADAVEAAQRVHR